MMPMLGLAMDGLLLLFLAGTMAFAWHLSRNITLFRQSRKEMDKLVQDIGAQIEKAERATAGLKRSADDAARDMQALTERAQGLSDELQMITESGDHLAKRLEKLSERGRDTPTRMPPLVTRREMPAARGQGDDKPAVASGGGGFAIRDREVEEKNDDAAPADDEFSKAERELMAALRMGPKNNSGRVR